MLTHWISKLRKFKNKCRVVLLCIRISRCALIAQFFFNLISCHRQLCVVFIVCCVVRFIKFATRIFSMSVLTYFACKQRIIRLLYIEKRLSICMHLTWNASETSNRVFCKQCTWHINCLMQLLNLNKLSVFFYELVQLTNFKTYNISITSTTSTTTLT